MEVAMVEALKYGGRQDQIAVATEIGKLDTKQRRKLVERGAVPPLVSMLLAVNDSKCVEAGLSALLNLACGSERNKFCVAKSEAIPALLKIIQWQDEALLEHAIGVLLILSSCSENKPIIVSSGMVQFLFQLLISKLSVGNRISDQVKLDIMCTLLNLSTSPEIVPLIVDSGGVMVLEHAIHVSEKSSKLVEKAMALLESIVSASGGALQKVSESQAMIRALVEAVEEGTRVCKEHAVVILMLICKSCTERYKGVILREGAVPGLLQLSVDGTKHGRDKAKELLRLLRDSHNHKGGNSRSHHSKKVLLEQVMDQIEYEERSGSSIQMVKEMLARLKT